MQVRNALRVVSWKYRMQKIAKNLPSRHHRTASLGCIFTTKAGIDNLKNNSLNGNMSSTCPHNICKLWPTSGWDRFGSLGAPQLISTGFACWLHYCSDVAHRRPTKLCTMFGHLVGWYTMYTFAGALASWRNFAGCEIHFTSKSCVLLYIGCVTARQSSSGVVHGMDLWNFCKGYHLYSAGRPSRLTSAHILVETFFLLWLLTVRHLKREWMIFIVCCKFNRAINNGRLCLQSHLATQSE